MKLEARFKMIDKKLSKDEQQRLRLETLEQRTLKLKTAKSESITNNISEKTSKDSNDKINYCINVTQKTFGYKVVVSKYEVWNTRNTRIGIDPLRLLTGKSGIRIYTGKKKQENKLLQNFEFTFEKSKWDRQLTQWCLENNLSDEIKMKIENEIRKIIRVENI